MTEQHGRPAASYKTYWEAERAVDHLPDHGFPVEGVAIIGQDVRLVEQVIGRMDYGRVALHGAASGALPGVLTGRLFGLVNWLDPSSPAPRSARADLRSCRRRAFWHAVAGPPPGFLLAPFDAAEPVGGRRGADEAVQLISALQTTGGGPIHT
ncbi:general stress protein [Streptomyces sp. NPDC003631]|uniref:General stress protein 17M-like domain-containing protein n=1 Tax=Streptomyces lannensis TaxID=766498 RepID=A0ABP7KIW1_9ACTN